MKDKIPVLHSLYGLCGRKATSKKMQSKTRLREQWRIVCMQSLHFHMVPAILVKGEGKLVIELKVWSQE